MDLLGIILTIVFGLIGVIALILYIVDRRKSKAKEQPGEQLQAVGETIPQEENQALTIEVPQTDASQVTSEAIIHALEDARDLRYTDDKESVIKDLVSRAIAIGDYSLATDITMELRYTDNREALLKQICQCAVHDNRLDHARRATKLMTYTDNREWAKKLIIKSTIP